MAVNGEKPNALKAELMMNGIIKRIVRKKKNNIIVKGRVIMLFAFIVNCEFGKG